MKPLRVLFVGDSDTDASDMTAQLRLGGFDVSLRRVVTTADMRATLDSDTFDAIVCEHGLPSLSVREALAVFQAHGAPAPFVVLAGDVSEETAVDILEAGADTLLRRSELARLVPVLERELGEAEERRARRAAVEALHKSEREFRRIVETSSEGIWIVDGAGRTTYANERMAALLATTPDALVGTLASDSFDDERTLFRDRMTAPGDAPVSRLECSLRRCDGSGLWAAVALSTLTDKEGKPVGVLAMVTDMTEQRRFQEQLLVSDRMVSVGTLAAGVAHEINNPLAAILGNLHLGLEALDAGTAGTPEGLKDLREELADSLEAAGRVRDIVRDLSLFSRTQDDATSTIDVSKVVEASVQLAWNEIRHRATLLREYGEVPMVFGNEARLCQVFLNIILNAVQALPDGNADANEIRIRIAGDVPKRVVVAIRDSGSGMSPDVLRRLFTPFFTTKPVGVGTGLGLAMSHRIITSLGGEIQIDSAVGKGTEVRVLLPTTVVSSPPPADSTHASSRPERRHLLVVDDEEIVGAFVRRALGTHHDVSVVHSGREALERILAGRTYDLVLCDLMMPQMNGMDLYDEVLAIAPDLAKRFVFTTGGAFTPEARAFLGRVSNPRIDKPFELGALRALVEGAGSDTSAP